MLNRPFPILGFQIDVGRRLERPATLYRALEGMSDAGYNVCMLYLEDAYAYPRHPRIGRPNAYSVAAMQEAHAICERQGIDLFPCIPALGHCSYITQKDGYAKYDEGRDTGQLTGTVSPSFPETYELLTELFEDWCNYIPGSYLHVGLDESPAMGRWAEQRGREVDHTRMFADHCNRLNSIVKGLGRRMLVWGDMFYYYPGAIELIDNDIIVVDWYYYSFPVTPRVEAFNFTDIDLTGQFESVGVEVWGAPSIWPNLPIGDIADRWQNVADWTRYGRERGMDGLLITDWENSWGFCEMSAWLFRTFGKLLISEASEKSTREELTRQLREELATRTGAPNLAELVDDLLALGNHHLTGRADRTFFSMPLASVAVANRETVCREHWNAVSEIDALHLPARPAPKANLLRELERSRRMIELAWKQGALVPEFARRVVAVARGGDDSSLAAEMRRLADETEAFGAAYQTLWDEERYGDEDHPTRPWGERSARELREWADVLEMRPATEHPLCDQPRLEAIFHCKHPSLPVAVTTVRWEDGGTQATGRAMINFASAYACPDKEWTEYPCLVLERRELPSEIVIEVNNYGQIGIGEVCVVWRGQRHIYRRVSAEGASVEIEGDIAWLGPVGATPADPTTRPDADRAVYRLI